MVKRAPSQLSTAGQRWWRRILREFEFNDHASLLLLQTALEAFDAMKDAQRILADEGQMVTDKWGQRKMHPMCIREKDSRTQMLACFRALNLDISAPSEGPGRPPEQFPGQSYRS